MFSVVIKKLTVEETVEETVGEILIAIKQYSKVTASEYQLNELKSERRLEHQGSTKVGR